MERTRKRNTRQKAVVYKALAETKAHPSAFMLLKMARRIMPSLSFATVYRNLKLLQSEGKAIEVARLKQRARYDGNTTNHYHFCCIRCQKIFDIDMPLVKDLDTRVSRSTGFQSSFHRTNFYGYCNACKK
jgi:Fur family transcriptional regulator, peroxide stress response regulator